MGWRDDTCSGQDGIRLSSTWEQYAWKGSGLSLCCSHSAPTWTAQDVAFLICCAWMNVIALQQALYITNGSRWWMRTCRAYMSRCVSLAWRLFGVATLPVALFKCSRNSRVRSPVTLTRASMTWFQGLSLRRGPRATGSASKGQSSLTKGACGRVVLLLNTTLYLSHQPEGEKPLLN